jgi:hypothetical protein
LSDGARGSFGPPALVVSSSKDAPTVTPVVERLRAAGLQVLVFEADRVAAGTQRFECSLTDGSLSIRLDGASFAGTDIAAAWWRKPQWLDIDRSDPGTRASLEAEIGRLQEDVWDLVPQRAWLNDPNRMQAAGRRFRQLTVAHAAGFSVPQTLVTNDGRAAIDFGHSGAVAFKTLNGVVTEGDRVQTLFTKRLLHDDLEHLVSLGTPYPGLLQRFISKRREWRITVVDETIFSAAIYTTPLASHDWREHQFTEHVKFRPEPLPAPWADRCVRVTKALGLSYAAIDLIESADGEWVFLEANPNGQYRWLEQQLGLPISDAVAAALVRRASMNPA